MSLARQQYRPCIPIGRVWDKKRSCFLSFSCRARRNARFFLQFYRNIYAGHPLNIPDWEIGFDSCGTVSGPPTRTESFFNNGCENFRFGRQHSGAGLNLSFASVPPVNCLKNGCNAESNRLEYLRVKYNYSAVSYASGDCVSLLPVIPVTPRGVSGLTHHPLRFYSFRA